MILKSRLNKQLEGIQGYNGKSPKDCTYDLIIIYGDNRKYHRCINFDELKTLIYNIYQLLRSINSEISMAQGLDYKSDIYVFVNDYVK